MMTKAVDELLTILDLEQLETNLYRGRSPQVGWQRVFGGQVIGQALVAACRTVGPCSRKPFRPPASITLCGCTSRSAPMNGCFIRRTPPLPVVIAALHAALFLRKTGVWWLPLHRKASSASARNEWMKAPDPEVAWAASFLITLARF